MERLLNGKVFEELGVQVVTVVCVCGQLMWSTVEAFGRCQSPRRWSSSTSINYVHRFENIANFLVKLLARIAATLVSVLDIPRAYFEWKEVCLLEKHCWVTPLMCSERNGDKDYGSRMRQLHQQKNDSKFICRKFLHPYTTSFSAHYQKFILSRCT